MSELDSHVAVGVQGPIIFTDPGAPMYKLTLCLRYLRSRYIALASIISVMLGVATMIVVNSVMAGFQEEMYKRLHGILSDLVVEAHSQEGHCRS